jgi:hypothetical protein
MSIVTNMWQHNPIVQKPAISWISLERFYLRWFTVLHIFTQHVGPRVSLLTIIYEVPGSYWGSYANMVYIVEHRGYGVKISI